MNHDGFLVRRIEGQEGQLMPNFVCYFVYARSLGFCGNIGRIKFSLRGHPERTSQIGGGGSAQMGQSKEIYIVI